MIIEIGKHVRVFVDVDDILGLASKVYPVPAHTKNLKLDVVAGRVLLQWDEDDNDQHK